MWRVSQSVRTTCSGSKLVIRIRGIDALEFVLTAPVKLEGVIMVLPQRLAVRHSEECDAYLTTARIHEALHIDADGTRALIENCKLRPVVEEAGHRYALLLSARQNVHPVLHRVESTLALHEIAEMHLLEVFLQLVIGDSTLAPLIIRVRVCDLIAESAKRHIRPLRNIKELLLCGLCEHAAKQGPQLTQVPEERTLSASVGAAHEDVASRLNLKGKCPDEEIAVWSDQRNLIKANDVILFNDASVVWREIQTSPIGASLALVRHHRAHILSRIEITQNIHQISHASSKPSKAGQFAASKNKPSRRSREVNEHATRAVIVLHDLIVGHVAVTLVAEVQERPAHDVESDNSRKVLCDDRVDASHGESELHRSPQQTHKTRKRLIDDEALALVAVVERNLLAVRNESRVDKAELALEPLLLDSVAPRGPAETREHKTRHGQIDHHGRRSLPSDGTRQLARVNNNVENGLADIRKQLGNAVAELLHILGEELIGIGDAIVEIVDLVVGESLEVLLVQVARQPRPEAETKLVESVLQEIRNDRNRHHRRKKTAPIPCESRHCRG
eukprot:Opistho-2@54248